jgi:hypothetical protein
MHLSRPRAKILDLSEKILKPTAAIKSKNALRYRRQISTVGEPTARLPSKDTATGLADFPPTCCVPLVLRGVSFVWLKLALTVNLPTNMRRHNVRAGFLA